MFGPEYRETGTLFGANRTSVTGQGRKGGRGGRFGDRGVLECPIVQLRAAMGASAVVAKMDGMWAHIPNPDATILARVQTGDEAYRLTTVAPNPAMLKQIFDRLLGRAREVLEVEVPTQRRPFTWGKKWGPVGVARRSYRMTPAMNATTSSSMPK